MDYSSDFSMSSGNTMPAMNYCCDSGTSSQNALPAMDYSRDSGMSSNNGLPAMNYNTDSSMSSGNVLPGNMGSFTTFLFDGITPLDSDTPYSSSDVVSSPGSCSPQTPQLYHQLATMSNEYIGNWEAVIDTYANTEAADCYDGYSIPDVDSRTKADCSWALTGVYAEHLCQYKQYICSDSSDDCIKYNGSPIDTYEHMSPWEYSMDSDLSTDYTAVSDSELSTTEATSRTTCRTVPGNQSTSSIPHGSLSRKQLTPKTSHRSSHTCQPMTRKSLRYSAKSPTVEDLNTEKSVKRARRERTSFTDRQLHTLESMFDEVKYPDVFQIEEISHKLNVTEDVIKIWFKNRRQNLKLSDTRGGKRKRSSQRDMFDERSMKRARKSRTNFSQEQMDNFEFLFAQVQYPDVYQRQELADHAGVNEEVIRVWFKNKRQKLRGGLSQ